MKESTISQSIKVAVSLATLTAVTMHDTVLGDCWIAPAVQCAWVNVDYCMQYRADCLPHNVQAVCLQNAYTYPATPASGDGVNATAMHGACIYPAVYQGCDNQPQFTYCYKGTAYATVDYENGSFCNGGG